MKNIQTILLSLLAGFAYYYIQTTYQCGFIVISVLGSLLIYAYPSLTNPVLVMIIGSLLAHIISIGAFSDLFILFFAILLAISITKTGEVKPIASSATKMNCPAADNSGFIVSNGIPTIEVLENDNEEKVIAVVKISLVKPIQFKSNSKVDHRVSMKSFKSKEIIKIAVEEARQAEGARKAAIVNRLLN